MNDKPPGVEEEALDWDGPPMDDAYVEAWIERNKGPLGRMVAEARAELDAGGGIPADEVFKEIDAWLAKKLAE